MRDGAVAPGGHHRPPVGARLDVVDQLPCARQAAVARGASVAWRTAFCACSVSRRSQRLERDREAEPGIGVEQRRARGGEVARRRDVALALGRATLVERDDRDDGDAASAATSAGEREPRCGAGAPRARAAARLARRRGTRARAR